MHKRFNGSPKTQTETIQPTNEYKYVTQERNILYQNGHTLKQWHSFDEQKKNEN